MIEEHIFRVWLWCLNWVKRYPLKTKVCFQPKCAFLNVLSIYKKIKVLKVAFLCRLIEQDQWHLLSFWTLQLYGIVNLIIIIAYIICFLARFFRRNISTYRLVKPGRRLSGWGQFELKFRFPLITFSLVNRFTSYSHTLLLRI